MPVNSGQGAYNVGADNTLVITGPNGLMLPKIITGFKFNQEAQELKSTGMDGVIRYGMIPQGWKGSFSVDRGDSTLDDLFAQMEQGYYNGGGLFAFAITQTIQEANGSVSQYRFEGVALKLASGGEFKGDSTVKQELNFSASFRKKVL